MEILSGVNFTKSKFFLILCTAFFLMGTLGGCSYGTPQYLSYVPDFKAGSRDQEDVADAFAKNLCVTNSDITLGDFSLQDGCSAGLFDLNHRKTLYSLHVNERKNPASLTKVMTALVALKHAKLDQTLTASTSVNLITEEGAQKIGLRAGDSMTLDQALHILLIYSANDVGIMIAENIGGSVDGFVKMMNEEALALGATNCHFQNPHGLQKDNHYVTAYDMYLIFQETMKFDEFQQIINMTSYTTQYYSSKKEAVAVDIKSTNRYFSGKAKMPSNITVIGGKTGTTTAAGHCLILLAKDTAGNPYIAVILGDTSVDRLYNDMTAMLEKAVE